MANMPCLVVRVDAATELAVREGEHVKAGQPIGKSRGRDGNEVSPKRGVVNCIQFDADSHSLLVFIDLKVN